MSALGLSVSDAVRLIEKQVSCGLWSIDLESNACFWSLGLHDLIGINPGDEVPGAASFEKYVLPSDRLQNVDVLQAAKDGQLDNLEYRVRRKDGTIIAVKSVISVIRGTDGRPLKLVGVVSEITERNAHRSLRGAWSTLLASLHQNQDLVVVTIDADGTLVDDWRWRELTGQSDRDTRDWAWLGALAAPDRESFRAAWAEAVARAQPIDIAAQITVVDRGAQAYRIHGTPIPLRSADVTGVLVFTPETARPTTAESVEGRWIKSARHVLGWSAEDLAVHAGVSVATVRRLEGSTRVRDQSIGAVQSALAKAGVLILADGDSGVYLRLVGRSHGVAD
jgi:PAS domain S-box-containing protein